MKCYLEHTQGDLGSKLQKVLGHDGGRTTLFALKYVAGDASAATIGNAVSAVRLEGEYFDSHLSGATARLIRQYQFKRDRMTDFFDGLAHWGAGNRSEAARLFDRVCEDDETDRAGAISAHLLGIVHYKSGNLPEARRLLENAVDRLDLLGDVEGLIVTLGSLGRTLRSVAEQDDDDDALEESINVLERAYALSTDGSLKRGRAAQYLAQTYTAARDFDRAVPMALEAVELAGGPMDRVNAILTLALLYREAGVQDLYFEATDRALEEAEGGYIDAMTLARASNMAAAAARRMGDLSRAERLARRSLAYGGRADLQGHVPHAAHTLAAVLIDQLERGEDDGESIEEITTLLDLARNELTKRHDRKGLDKVAGTRGRLNAILFRNL